jgi:hypothetical protein
LILSEQRSRGTHFIFHLTLTGNTLPAEPSFPVVSAPYPSIVRWRSFCRRNSAMKTARGQSPFLIHWIGAVMATRALPNIIFTNLFLHLFYQWCFFWQSNLSEVVVCYISNDIKRLNWGIQLPLLFSYQRFCVLEKFLVLHRHWIFLTSF